MTRQDYIDLIDALNAATDDADNYISCGAALEDYLGDEEGLRAFHAKVARWRALAGQFEMEIPR